MSRKRDEDDSEAGRERIRSARLTGTKPIKHAGKIICPECGEEVDRKTRAGSKTIKCPECDSPIPLT